MSNIAIPNTFAPSTTALSADVNANFTEIATKFNTYAVQKDVAATITAIHTYSTAPVFGFATASQALELDASKNVQSVAITGTGNYVKSADPTFTGTVTMAGLTTSGTTASLVQSATTSVAHVGSGTGSGTTQVNIRGAAGQLRELSWRSGTAARWKLYVNSDAEAGANAGSTAYFAAYDDAGSVIGDVWSVVRAAGGAMSILRPLAVTAAVTIAVASGAQFTAQYDGSNYATLTVGASGIATFNAVGAGASFVFSDAVTVNNATPLYGLSIAGALVSSLAHVSSRLRIAIETGESSIDFATAGTTVRARVAATASAGETYLLIYDEDNATLERVSVGAADSGGVGYKLLRIPN